MKKIILIAVLLVHFFNVHSQKNPVQYTDKEWQEMMTYLEGKCELVRLSVSKKYKKKKIKKDLRIVKLINELQDKQHIEHSTILKTIKGYKLKLNTNFRTADGDIEYLVYDVIGGYLACELSIAVRDNGAAYRMNIAMENLDYMYVCEEMGDAPLLNFHYVYQYLRPSAKFKIGFTGYEGGFISQIELNKST